MDGFDANEGIIIIAATNRPDVLDPALLRPGRFDRRVTVPLPDIEGRMKILDVHMKKVPLAPDVDARTLARGTPGMSGADLANLVNEAALMAARLGKRLVAMAQFELAKDRVIMGTEWRSLVMTDDEKKMTAYHEAGHALVRVHEKASDPIHKATIIPRGGALGMVVSMPERDNYSYHRDKMYADLASVMGGRVAEEVIFGHDKVSSGASTDIQQATKLARAMVMQWGMSDKLGPLQYEEAQGETFLGYSQTQRHNMSNETALMIDAEIRALVDGGHARATEIIKTNVDQLHSLAGALLELETLTGDEIKTIIARRQDRPQRRRPGGAPDRGLVDPPVEAAQARYWRTGAGGRLMAFNCVNPRSSEWRAGRIVHAFVNPACRCRAAGSGGRFGPVDECRDLSPARQQAQGQGTAGPVFAGRNQGLMNEGKAAGEASRRQRLAAIKAGKQPRYCPPEGPQKMGSDEFMTRLGAIPRPERQRITMTEATTRILTAKFPCR